MDLIEWVEGIYTGTVLTTLDQEIVFGVEVEKKKGAKGNFSFFAETLDAERDAIRVSVGSIKDVICRIHIYS